MKVTRDDVGNRTASHQGSGYQPFNRLVAANGTAYGFDLNGNETSKSDACGNWKYTWDYENRLTQASLTAGVTVDYQYDAGAAAAVEAADNSCVHMREGDGKVSSSQALNPSGGKWLTCPKSARFLYDKRSPTKAAPKDA